SAPGTTPPYVVAGSLRAARGQARPPPRPPGRTALPPRVPRPPPIRCPRRSGRIAAAVRARRPGRCPEVILGLIEAHAVYEDQRRSIVQQRLHAAQPDPGARARQPRTGNDE